MRSGTPLKTSWTSLALAFCLAWPAQTLGDCLGPPTVPVIRIDVTHCEFSKKYDNTLKITATAQQVLTMHYSFGTASGEIEFSSSGGVLSEDTFWITVSPGTDCQDFLQRDDEVWIYGDICNDTLQNIPSIQLIAIWPEEKAKAMRALAKADLERSM